MTEAMAAHFIVRASSQFLLHPGGNGLDLLKHSLDAINRFLERRRWKLLTLLRYEVLRCQMKLKPNEILNLPGLVPQRDERLMHLLEGAIASSVPVYFAAVPLGLCVPFDLDYRPDKHPVGEAAIRDAFEQAKAGSFPKMFTYQRGAWFIVSDEAPVDFRSFAVIPHGRECIRFPKELIDFRFFDNAVRTAVLPDAHLA